MTITITGHDAKQKPLRYEIRDGIKSTCVYYINQYAETETLVFIATWVEFGMQGAHDKCKRWIDNALVPLDLEDSC